MAIHESTVLFSPQGEEPTPGWEGEKRPSQPHNCALNQNCNILLGKDCQKLIAKHFAEKIVTAAGLAAEQEFKIVPSG
jgi:hypothetical protein